MPAIVALASFVFTAIAIQVLTRRAVLDQPNARSSHTRPTPRGGGIALLAALVPAALGHGPLPLWLGFTLLVAISFADDLYSLPALPRLLAQVAAVAVGLAAFPGFTLIQALAAAFLWLWFVNLFNFMDGIDGLATVEALSIGLGASLAAFLGGGSLAIGLLIAAAAAGFLPWNWRPARIFLGDVGSIPLGYLLGYVLLTLTADGFWPAAFILPLYFLADATLTLLKRLVRGERIWQGHRTHWYQRAATAAGRHDVVTLRVAVANAALIGAAVAATIVSPLFIGAGLVIVALLLVELERLSHSRDAIPTVSTDG